jgi:serine/threonine-protein kinase
VLVGRDVVTLADAGTAVLADPAEPARRAPELWQAHPPSAATDVYAATCIFVECLVGHPTYRGPALSSLMGGHTTAPIPMAEVPEPLRPLLAGGLAKDPAYRLTASALAAEAQRVAAAAYGAGWEQAGLAELGAIAGPLIEPFPPAPAGPPAPASDPPMPVSDPSAPASGPLMPASDLPMPVSDPSAPASGPLMPASDLPMPVSGPSAPASGPPVPKSRPKSRPEPAPGVAAGPRAAGSGRSGAGGRSSGRGGRSRRPALAALPAAGLAIVLASAVSAALDGREPSAPPAHGRPSARTAAPPATHRPPARPRTTPLATIPRPAPRRTAPHPTAPPRRTTPPPAGCTAAPGLTLSPSSGGPGTLITVVGSGVVRGGRVDVHFHADQMGSTRTTADGCFQLTAPIPNADFYANFGTQAYDIYVTEYDADGRYAGNGPGRQRFLLTGS